MSLKGWGLAILLIPFTLGLSVLVYFYIWFFAKIGKFYIKAMTFSIKAAVGLIAWPFKAVIGALGGTFHFFELMYYQGVHNIKSHDDTTYSNMHGYEGEGRNEEESDDEGFLSTVKSGFSFLSHYKYRYVAIFLVIVWFFNFPSTVLGLIQDPTELLSLTGMIEFIPTLLFISVPFIVTIFLSAISFEFLGDGTKFFKASDHAVNQAKNLGEGGAAAAGAVAGGAAAAGQTAKEAGQAGLEAKEMAETAVTSASHIETASGMIGGGEAAAGEAAAGEAAAAEGLGGLVAGSGVASALGTAAPVAVVLLLAWLVYTIIAGIISLVLVIATWGMVAQVIPMFAGPVLGALGVGGAYANLIGDEVSNSEVGISIMQGDMFEPQMRAANQAMAKLGCMAKGPQCFRQWQMNNTVRPGSEARGETYELQISEFGLGTDTVDVAYKEANYTLPVNFLVENTRNGLKGINARNVSYKVSILDSDETYCTTGWEKVSSFDDGRNYILPGLGVSPTGSLEELNLGNCGLLQPSLGSNLVMDLQVKYNYASQATLYVDAMSREHRREQGIEPGFKKSETARTPVQSYINVNSPITYYETESGGRNAVPFAARFGFQTPGFNAKYRIMPESIQIADSSITTHTDTCSGLQRDEDMGPDYYEVSESAKERITLRQQNNWFSADVEPAPLRCTMKIEDEDLGQISPTGEQLVMRIDGNYTIVKEDEMTGFDVQNTLCTRHNCPLLVTEAYNESSPYNLHSKCSADLSVDTRDGCSVRDPEEGDSGWRVPSIVEGLTIQQGDVARGAGAYIDDLDLPFDQSYSEKGNLNIDESSPISAPQLSRRQENSNGVVIYQRGEERKLEIETLNNNLCRQEAETEGIDDMTEATRAYMETWSEKSGVEGSPVKIGINTVSCEEPLKERIKDVYGCEFGLISEAAGAYVDYTTDVYTLNFDDATNVDFNLPDSCRDIGRNPLSCDGVLTERSNEIRCYGGQFGN